MPRVTPPPSAGGTYRQLADNLAYLSARDPFLVYQISDFDSPLSLTEARTLLSGFGWRDFGMVIFHLLDTSDNIKSARVHCDLLRLRPWGTKTYDVGGLVTLSSSTEFKIKQANTSAVLVEVVNRR